MTGPALSVVTPFFGSVLYTNNLTDLKRYVPGFGAATGAKASTTGLYRAALRVQWRILDWRKPPSGAARRISAASGQTSLPCGGECQGVIKLFHGRACGPLSGFRKPWALRGFSSSGTATSCARFFRMAGCGRTLLWLAASISTRPMEWHRWWMLNQ